MLSIRVYLLVSSISRTEILMYPQVRRKISYGRAAVAFRINCLAAELFELFCRNHMDMARCRQATTYR